MITMAIDTTIQNTCIAIRVQRHGTGGVSFIGVILRFIFLPLSVAFIFAFEIAFSEERVSEQEGFDMVVYRVVACTLHLLYFISRFSRR